MYYVILYSLITDQLYWLTLNVCYIICCFNITVGYMYLGVNSLLYIFRSIKNINNLYIWYLIQSTTIFRGHRLLLTPSPSLRMTSILKTIGSVVSSKGLDKPAYEVLSSEKVWCHLVKITKNEQNLLIMLIKCRCFLLYM